MTEAVLDIKKWGNSLGVRLPAAVAHAARLHVDQRVRGAKMHPLRKLPDNSFDDVCRRLNQIIQIGEEVRP